MMETLSPVFQNRARTKLNIYFMPDQNLQTLNQFKMPKYTAKLPHRMPNRFFSKEKN
jgi:hypothetical protein